jgi:sugar lactone lactonase YvrE
MSLLAFFALSCSDDSTGPGDPDPDPLACDDTPGSICTWAGTGDAAFDGDGHSLLASSFYWPIDLTFLSSGKVVILDWNNHRVRMLQPDNTLQTIIGTDMVGDGPPDFSDFIPPGAPGTTIDLNHPTHILELPDGRLLLTAWHNHKMRVWDPNTGLTLVTCGRGAGFRGDGGPAEDALLNQPQQTILSTNGDLYVLDQRNQRVRMIAGDTGIITTVVGSGVAGFAGDGGPPLEAQISLHTGSNPPASGAIALDDQGRLYISDTKNHRIRMVDFDQNVITTIAGNGLSGYNGDDQLAVQASLNNPKDVEVGPDGRLYVADDLNNRVRAIDPATGIITTVAGNGEAAFAGDGGPAVEASLFRPSGIAFDSEERLYIADTFNNRIRRVNP